MQNTIVLLTLPLPSGGAVGLQAGSSRVRFPTVSLELFIDIILPSAAWPRGRPNH